MIQFVGSCEEDRRNFKITEKKEFWFRNFSDIIAILVTNDTREIDTLPAIWLLSTGFFCKPYCFITKINEKTNFKVYEV